MELVKKWDHTKEEGIYKVSRKVKSYSQIRKEAEALREYLDTNNGHFDAMDYKTAYALSHCQVDTGKDPWHFFVLGYEFLIQNKDNRPKKDTKKNFYFPSQIIVNAEVIEAPERLQVTKPVRELVRNGKQVTTKIVLKEAMENNLIGVPEACMSFSMRKPRTTKRYFRVKVRYQYPVKVLGIWFLRTKTEWAEGLKAHILQHECDHAQGKNMYYDNK